MNPQPLVSIRNVNRSFGPVRALEDVTLDINENEFFALLGPSGCGKTTLLRAIAGFEIPDSGQVFLDGADLIPVPPHKRPVNLMFQSYALVPHMSVEKNIAYGLEREGLPKSEVNQRVDEVLETVDLADKAKQRPQLLSGGQKQRVALARAIVKRPRLLLLDEPLSALDKKVRAEMQLELKRLQHEVGITFVVVTHDQEEAMSMANRIAVMHQGQVQQIASPVDLYRSPANLFVADFIGTSNQFVGSAAPEGVQVDGFGTLPGRAHAPERGVAATLIVRPEDTALVDADAAILSGTVTETVFTGGQSTLAVTVVGRSGPVLVTSSGAPSVGRGDSVHLAWDPQRAVVLSA
jgi:spermidine/putrescine transport system ATP-binding protein/putrescine transport system ATP-binding protein